MVTKVMIATPVYSDVSLEYVESILKLKDFYLDKKVILDIKFTSGNSIIHDARNSLVDRFLKSDNEFLFFIDSDIVFTTDSFDEVLKCCFDNDKHIVTGICPKRQVDWDFMYYAISQGKKDLHNYNSVFNHTFDFSKENVDLTKPVEVNDSGTGFMCIKREVIETLDKKVQKKYYRNPKDKSKLTTSFFDFAVIENTNQFVGEDIFFCHLAKSFGFKVWICPWLLFGHKGDYLYTGSFNEAFDLYKQYITSGEYKNNYIKLSSEEI